jgi:checkpoint serine/threonine-protein kinase
MFYAIELLRTVEALHAVSIVHGSIGPESILLRNDVSGDVTNGLVTWSVSGNHGWDCIGLAPHIMHILLFFWGS